MAVQCREGGREAAALRPTPTGRRPMGPHGPHGTGSTHPPDHGMAWHGMGLRAHDILVLAIAIAVGQLNVYLPSSMTAYLYVRPLCPFGGRTTRRCAVLCRCAAALPALQHDTVACMQQLLRWRYSAACMRMSRQACSASDQAPAAAAGVTCSVMDGSIAASASERCNALGKVGWNAVRGQARPGLQYASSHLTAPEAVPASACMHMCVPHSTARLRRHA